MARRKKPTKGQLEEENLEEEVVEEEVVEEENLEEEVVEETEVDPSTDPPVVETSEVPEVIQPCCLPQHDPTLRSARTTKQAEEMTRTLRNNNPK